MNAHLDTLQGKVIRYETAVKSIPSFSVFLQDIRVLETLVMISYSCTGPYGSMIQLPSESLAGHLKLECL